jgi:hypothetical protein
MASSPMSLHGTLQDENTSTLKNEPLTALRCPCPGIPQNMSTMVGSPHKTNFHPQKGMYQRMTKYHSEYVVTSHPRRGGTNL